MLQRRFFLALWMLASMCGSALADAATHRFDFVSVKNYQSDCYKDKKGKRQCSPFCMVTGKLTNLTDTTAPDVLLEIFVKNPLNPREDGEDSRFTFQFDDVAIGKSLKTGSDIPFSVCQKLEPTRITVSCGSSLRSGLCGFVNVDVAANKTLRLPRRRISN